MSEHGFPVDFNPLMTQTMLRKDLQKLLLSLSGINFWNGRTYKVKSTHLGAGVYEVTGDFDD